MELVVRIHHHMRSTGQAYRIEFVPDPVCWTEAPEDRQTLRNQRIRWQRGLSESLSSHWGLMFSRRGGWVGWLAFPYMVLFEWLGPLIELAGYIWTLYAWWAGFLSGSSLVLFACV
jgi:cellulose synthase/poly-beta-1,6-N-acetylglucosamine synthase-like glycosyltransferase